MGTFKKGFVVGGLLGAGMMWLNTTKKGKETRAQVLEVSHTIYNQIEKEVLASKQWKSLSKSEFVARVTELVDTYAVENGLGADLKKLVVKVVATQYPRIKKKFESMTQ